MDEVCVEYVGIVNPAGMMIKADLVNCRVFKMDRTTGKPAAYCCKEWHPEDIYHKVPWRVS